MQHLEHAKEQATREGKRHVKVTVSEVLSDEKNEDSVKSEMESPVDIKTVVVEEEHCGVTSVEGQIINGFKPILDGPAPINSGTGRGNELKGEGSGRENWGPPLMIFLRKLKWLSLNS